MTDADERDKALAAMREMGTGMLDDSNVHPSCGQAILKWADILEEQSETCKFNCRNQREIWVHGYVTAHDELCAYAMGYDVKQHLIAKGDLLYEANKEVINNGDDKETDPRTTSED